MMKVDFESLLSFGVSLLEAKGLSEEDARYIADAAVTAEAAGVHTHGVVVFVGLAGSLGKALAPERTPCPGVLRLASTSLRPASARKVSICSSGADTASIEPRSPSPAAMSSPRRRDSSCRVSVPK